MSAQLPSGGDGRMTGVGILRPRTFVMIRAIRSSDYGQEVAQTSHLAILKKPEAKRIDKYS